MFYHSKINSYIQCLVEEPHHIGEVAKYSHYQCKGSNELQRVLVTLEDRQYIVSFFCYLPKKCKADYLQYHLDLRQQCWQIY